MTKIKCLFPGNNYLLRKISIKIDDKLVAKIGHNEVIELDLEQHHVRFSLDYHKAKIDGKELKNDSYLILYFDFRDYFPYNFIDIMFKNSLRAKIVSELEFKNFNETFYSTKTQETELIKWNFSSIYSVIVGFLFSIGFVSNVWINQNNSDTNNFAFIIGLASFIGFVHIVITHKKITIQQFRLRIIAFGVLCLILIPFMDLTIVLKIALYLLSASILVLNLTFTKS